MSLAVQAVFAGLPIAFILFAMLGLGWSAARAGGLGLALTAVIAWTLFGFGTWILPETGPALSLAGALLEAGFIALTILWIIFPALCVHELQQATGAVNALRDAISGLSPDPRISALLVAWFFALFMEGAAGFGTSAALAAPFLVSMGIAKVEAVCIALIGHAVGVSFGAVGTPIELQIAVTPFTGVQLSAATAVYHAVLGWCMALMLIVLVNRALPSRSPRPLGGFIWLWTLLAAGAFLLPYYALASTIGPELPTLGGALLGGLLFVAVLLLHRKGQVVAVEAVPAKAQVPLFRAAAPYLILIGLILSTRLVPSVSTALRERVFEWQLMAFEGSVALFYHPGTMLLLSFFAAALWQRASVASVLQAMRKAFGRVLLVTPALIAMLGLSRIMVHAEMIEVLAIATTTSVGSAWPLLAPFVGALGTFVTGSATASNILFTEFQQATAERLGLSALALLGAQGFGAAIGNVVCPHNIIAASAVVGIQGKEAPVLRGTAGIMFVYTLLGGLLAWLAFA